MQTIKISNKFKSPNFDNRTQKIKFLVLHYTGMESARAAIDRLCDERSSVSAHYVIDLDGVIYNLVDEEYRAYHAGVSYWRGDEKLNDSSIGIEIVNKGHEFGYHPFPEIQMQSVIKLSKEIIKKHEIESVNVVAHSDIAPDRKEDPGELFDWQLLHVEGIGIYHDITNPDQTIYNMDILSFQGNLKKLGYKIEMTGILDDQTKKVVIAFKRHFNPKVISDVITVGDLQILEKLLTL